MVLVVFQWLNNLMRLNQWKKLQLQKRKEKPLQEIYGEGEKDPDGFDEEHGDEE